MSSINLSQITLEAALNDPAPLDFDRAPVAAITCRVCERPAQIPILANGLLCSACRVDLDATEQRIARRLAEAEQQLVKQIETWDALYDLAGPTDQERYQRVCQARLDNRPNFQARYDQARATDDGLGMLLRSKAHLDIIADATQRVRGWAEVARGEVEAAREADHGG